MKSAKQAMRIDLSERYKDSDVLELMNKAAFLDPQFKTLAHLPASTVEDITMSIQREMVNVLQQDSPEDQSSEFIEKRKKFIP